MSHVHALTAAVALLVLAASAAAQRIIDHVAVDRHVGGGVGLEVKCGSLGGSLAFGHWLLVKASSVANSR